LELFLGIFGAIFPQGMVLPCETAKSPTRERERELREKEAYQKKWSVL
jgi:hypothetical protein